MNQDNPCTKDTYDPEVLFSNGCFSAEQRFANVGPIDKIAWGLHLVLGVYGTETTPVQIAVVWQDEIYNAISAGCTTLDEFVKLAIKHLKQEQKKYRNSGLAIVRTSKKIGQLSTIPKYKKVVDEAFNLQKDHDHSSSSEVKNA